MVVLIFDFSMVLRLINIDSDISCEFYWILVQILEEVDQKIYFGESPPSLSAFLFMYPSPLSFQVVVRCTLIVRKLAFNRDSISLFKSHNLEIVFMFHKVSFRSNFRQGCKILWQQELMFQVPRTLGMRTYLSTNRIKREKLGLQM